MSRVIPFPIDRAPRDESRYLRRVAPPAPVTRSGLGRGIWREPFRVGGRPCLVAVDAAGEQIARLAIRDGLEEGEIIILLQQLLDVVDAVAAVPPLELVR